MKTASSSLKNSTLLDKAIEGIPTTVNEIPNGIVLRTIKIARTKGGIPCLWESYSEFDSLIRTTIISDSSGTIKDCVFIRDQKNKQALVPIKPGDNIIKVFKDTVGIAVSVLAIQDISSQKNEALIYPIFRKESLEETEYPKVFSNVITKCIEKLDNDNLIVSHHRNNSL